MKRYILLIYLFAFTNALFAQTVLSDEPGQKSFSTQRSLELGLGLGYLANQDLVFSPFIHRDLAFPAAVIGYESQGKFIHKISLRYTSFSTMLNESYDYFENGGEETTAPHSFTSINLGYDVGMPMQVTGKHRIIGGLSLSWDIHSLNYSYGRVGSFGYYSGTGIGVFGKYEWFVSESTKVSANIQIPLVSWFARSPYLVNDDEFIENISSHKGIPTFIDFLGDGKFVTLNRLQRLSAVIEGSHILSDHWAVGGEWSFGFIHASRPRNLISYQNTLAGKVIYVF